jgi:hypothetical protein
VFDSLSIKELQSAVHPLKDVEGMHPASIGNIVYNELELAPCTATASVELLQRTGIALEGLNAVVVRHSEIVGKPIAFMLMAEGATVTVCHHMTRNLTVHSRHADALFVAIGKPRMIKAEMIKPGAVVIDFEINWVEGEAGAMITVGDVDYQSCREVAGWITPVQGGVGSVYRLDPDAQHGDRGPAPARSLRIRVCPDRRRTSTRCTTPLTARRVPVARRKKGRPGNSGPASLFLPLTTAFVSSFWVSSDRRPQARLQACSGRVQSDR